MTLKLLTFFNLKYRLSHFTEQWCAVKQMNPRGYKTVLIFHEKKNAKGK